jgi:hypothetical protein
MNEFEPNIDTKITAMLDHWTTKTAYGNAIDVFSWVHWLGFDTVCESIARLKLLYSRLHN